MPSPDTILRGNAEQATNGGYIQTNKGIENKVNINKPMNNLLVSCAKHFGILTGEQEQEELIYNFDHQFIEAEKYDATYSYNKAKGYFPAVVSIKGRSLFILKDVMVTAMLKQLN
ncbi:MAG: hypothetical protein ACK5H1_10605 [Tenacibaculum sp.]